MNADNKSWNRHQKLLTRPLRRKGGWTVAGAAAEILETKHVMSWFIAQQSQQPICKCMAAGDAVVVAGFVCDGAC
jgi:hypothetical protein